MPETVTNKVPTYVTNVVQHEVPKSDLFDVFWGLRPEAPQGCLKDPPGALQGQILSKIAQKSVLEILFPWSYSLQSSAIRAWTFDTQPLLTFCWPILAAPGSSRLLLLYPVWGLAL